MTQMEHLPARSGLSAYRQGFTAIFSLRSKFLKTRSKELRLQKVFDINTDSEIR